MPPPDYSKNQLSFFASLFNLNSVILPHRGVAQLVEYTSGGRGVAGSTPVSPTLIVKGLHSSPLLYKSNSNNLLKQIIFLVGLLGLNFSGLFSQQTAYMNPDSEKLSWWQTTTIYQIYPRSFYDSNADGIGDIQGIISKLDYLKNLGVETIWCSPFFASPQRDFGYDITSYTDIAPEYGTLADALQLVAEVHKRDMKIVFDMVMNHTSDQHPWFLESKKDKTNAKADWYIWTDTPNNWRSMPGGSGWHFCRERNQYYLATFLPFQPDLNYRNPEVKKAMLENVRFWLERGVDGFRLDIFNVIYKDEALRSNPFGSQLIPSEENPFGYFQQAKYNMNQPETMLFAKELRQLTDSYGDKLLLGEVTGNIENIRQFAGDTVNDGLGLVFNFEMLRFSFKASYFKSLIEKMEQHFHEPFMPVYVFSNHDRRRAATRLKGDLEKAKILLTLQLTVRGVPCLYYGEEIGMQDNKLPYKTALDPIPHHNSWVPRFLTELANETINRDDLRTPMQWNESQHAGFSKAENTWLPVHENYTEINVQHSQNNPNSLFHMVKKLLQIRNEYESLQSGNLEWFEIPRSLNVLAFSRQTNQEKLTVLINFDGKSKSLQNLALKGEIIYSIKGSTLAEIKGLDCLIVKTN
jgi:alpha-glucosidase